MRIIVCIKPVKTELVYCGGISNEALVMNPYDLFALKQCLEFKTRMNCHITCICMGPENSEYVMTKALALGADDAILLNDNKFSGSDTVATTYILAKAVDKMGGAEIIAMGQRSIDGETGQVVFGLADRLGYPCITRTVEIVEGSASSIILKHFKKNDERQVKVNIPCVISFDDFELTQPEISLPALKRARKKVITVWNAGMLEADLSKCGLEGSKTKVVNVKSEMSKKEIHKLDGSMEEKAAFIIKMALKG